MDQDLPSLILSAATDGYWDWNLTTDRITLSPQFCELLGSPLTAPPFDRASLEKVVHPVDRLRVFSLIDVHLRGRCDALVFECRISTGDGRFCFVEWRGRVVAHAEHDLPSRMVGTIVKLANREREIPLVANLPERESHLLFSNITKQVPGALFQTVVSPDGHICTPYSSESLSDIYEVSPEQIRGNIAAIVDRFHPKDRDRILESISTATEHLSKWDCEYRVILPSQGLKWLHGLGMPRKCEDGTVIIYGFISDITERKRVEEALHHSQVMLSSIFENAPYAFFVKDAKYDFRVIQWNKAAESIFGIAAADIVGKNAHDLWPKEQADAFLRQDLIVVNSRGLSDIQEEESIHPEKGTIYLHTRKIPLLDEQGEVDKIVVFSEDVTFRKLVEQEIIALNTGLEEKVNLRTAELKTAIRELESFSYSVSHDLRAPLRHINSYSTILLEDYGQAIPPEARYYLDAIGRSTSKMGELIDSLLELSQLSRCDLKREPVDLTALATGIAHNLQEIEPSRAVTFSIEKGLAACGDRVLVKQLLANLIGNAWKYSAGRDLARIEFGKTEQGVFFIKDNGVGFDMAYSAMLFQIFQRLHGAEFEGMGIGLATVKRIIDRHGGCIWAQSNDREGAVFYFTLPDGDNTSASECVGTGARS